MKNKRDYWCGNHYEMGTTGNQWWASLHGTNGRMRQFNSVSEVAAYLQGANDTGANHLSIPQSVFQMLKDMDAE